MKRPREIAAERAAMGTITGLTSVFESLASMRIAQTKSQVIESQKFFDALWQIYTQMRVDSLFRFGRDEHEEVINKELYIIITAEGSFSGDIDEKLIKNMLEHYNRNKNDLMVIGHHGATLLADKGIKYKKYFKLPVKDQNINVQPLIDQVRGYRNTVVFYQSYSSLMVQEVRQIELQKAVQEAGSKREDAKVETISESNYIFEPDSFAVVAHLERSMLKISLSQLILDSKLAQYASRFRSMSVAKHRASDSERLLRLQYNRTKRAISDERLKEVVNGLRKEPAL